MTYPPEPFGVMEISGALGGSLLVPVTWNDPGATPDGVSAAVTVATCTILPFGGHREHPVPGIPEITGAVSSILTTGEIKLALFPARSVAVTTPETAAPWAERTSGLAGFVDATPAPVSLAVNGMVTLVLFQPFAFGAGTG